jgi:hypothetical protein
MRVTQDPTSHNDTPPPPRKKVSRAEYARKRRANCGEVFQALREIKAIIAKLESDGVA